MSGADLKRRLLRNGWRLVRVRGSHHRFEKGGMRFTAPIHASKDVSIGVLQYILSITGPLD